jgi:hypothetical protein
VLHGNLFKGEFAPDLEHEHLALFRGQAPECGFDVGAAVVAFQRNVKKGLNVLQPALGAKFAGAAARVAPGEIRGGAPHGGEQERLRLPAQTALIPPEPDKGILHDVLGIRE